MNSKTVAGWMFAIVLGAEFIMMIGLSSATTHLQDFQLEALMDAGVVGLIAFCAFVFLRFVHCGSFGNLRGADWQNGAVILVTVIGFESVFHPLSENLAKNFVDTNVEFLNAVLLAAVVACVSGWVHAVDVQVGALVPNRKVVLRHAGGAVLLGVLVCALCVSGVAAFREINQFFHSYEVTLGSAFSDAVARQRGASHRVGRTVLMQIENSEGSLSFVNVLEDAKARAKTTTHFAKQYLSWNQSTIDKTPRFPDYRTYSRAWARFMSAAQAFRQADTAHKRDAALALQYDIDEFSHQADALVVGIATLERARALHNGSVAGEVASGLLVFLMSVGLLMPLLRLTGAQMGRIGISLRNAERLNKNLEAYQRALDAHTIVSVSDRYGKIIQANEHFLRISKYTREEVISQSHRILLSNVHTPEFFDEMWRTLARGQSWRGEICNRAGDGSLYWVDACITPLLGEDGKPEQYVSMCSDITERKESEKRFERRQRLGRAIENMRAEYMSHGSIYGSLPSVLAEVNLVTAASSSLVVELGRNEEGKAWGLMLGYSKRSETQIEFPAGSQPRLINDAGQHKLVEDAVHLGEMFGGLGAKQLGSAEFTGFPIAVGFEPVGVLLIAGDVDRLDFDSEITMVVGALAELMSARRESDRRRTDEEKSKKMAKRDPLTGLGNRRDLTEEFESRTDHPDSKFALLLIDLDRFKPINDTFGHLVGDMVLRVVAERLSAVAKGDFTVSRMGGDEFAILTEPHAGVDEAASLDLAARVIEVLSSPIRCDQHELSVGASIGVALFPRDGSNFQELLHAADAAMYRAKVHRCEAQMFDAAKDDGMRKKAELETDLKRALEADEIVPYFQPFVDLNTGVVVGHEVLARWNHPSRGDVPPSEFVKVAEEAGLVDRLFWQMLKAACRKHLEGGHSTILSVNLSPAQINNPIFAKQLIEELEVLKFPPHLLEVEITETSMIGDVDRARPLLLLLKSCGIQIALDDFGTGYSSLALLRSMPISKLKIDRSFTSDLESAEGTRGTLINAILGISKAMFLKVTAEGIELPEVAEYLREQGCQYGQGYLFSKGLPEITTTVGGVEGIHLRKSA